MLLFQLKQKINHVEIRVLDEVESLFTFYQSYNDRYNRQDSVCKQSRKDIFVTRECVMCMLLGKHNSLLFAEYFQFQSISLNGDKNLQL